MDQEYTRSENFVKRNLQTISRSVGELQKNVDKIGTPLATADQSRQIKILQTKTSELIKETSTHLRTINNAPPLHNQSEERQRKLHNERYLKSFNDSVQGFQAAQRKIAHVEQESVRQSRDSQGYDQDTNTTQYSNNQIQISVEQHSDLALLREREKALHDLESDITDINTIMKDLHGMITDQGEVIDSIEYNVESAAAKVEDGGKQLQKAHKSQSSARRKKFILAGIIAAILIVIVIILAITLS